MTGHVSKEDVLEHDVADMMMSAKDYIANRVNKRARLEKDILLMAGEHNVSRQLAEECCELAQACIKFQRTLDVPSDTPLTREEATLMLVEEFTDVLVCAAVLGLTEDADMFDAKLERWKHRLTSSAFGGDAPGYFGKEA